MSTILFRTAEILLPVSGSNGVSIFDFFRPLGTSAILSRMLRNVLTYRVIAFNSESSSKNMDGLFKFRDLKELFESVLSLYEGGGDESISTCVSASVSLANPFWTAVPWIAFAHWRNAVGGKLRSNARLHR
jgi:hypothetical protein